MAFNVVYNALQVKFPEIDSRVLKAVALENRNDAKAAMDVVLTKVLPCMSSRSRSSNSPSHSSANVNSPSGSEMDGSGGQQNVLKNASCSDEEQPNQFYDAECHDQLLDDANDAKIHESYLNGDSRVDNMLITENVQIKAHVSSDLTATTCSSLICESETDFDNENLLGFEAFSPKCTDATDSDLVKEPHSPESASGEIDTAVTLLGVENVTASSNVGLSRSVQICSTDVLEDGISLERNKKKTMFTALESVISLMKEVELEESVTAQVKNEASKGGLETMQKVDNLKEMLQHAKEANEMHAGEVNGEKAILVSEVKELQSRLIRLSDETDKSLAILNEMRQSLVWRLAALNQEREAALKEKVEKEAIAKIKLADQELIMEKVVEEANILKKQADENAKLRDFLVDRGHLVDSLQGEISVICQDVIMLKKQFDDHLPLSKSLTSSQTSCILASSCSSMKSVAPVLSGSFVAEPVGSLVTEPECCFEEKRWRRGGSSLTSEMSLFSDEMEAAAAATAIDDDHKAAAAIDDGHKADSDEGWEIFDA